MAEINQELIKSKVDQIFVELFEVKADDLSPDKRLFEDLGLDSLDAIDMVIRFQKEFRIKPSNQEIQHLKTLGDIYGLIAVYASQNKDLVLN
jgi:acyl carrier protein